MTTHIMIDLETMGNGPEAAIVAIGATSFDDRDLFEGYHMGVDLESSVKLGGIMDASTVLWWLKQSDAARTALTTPPQVKPLTEALQDFSLWMGQQDKKDDLWVWGNGASFDNVILRAAYAAARIDPPWHWWNDRCYRTLKAMHPAIKMTRSGTHHHAHDDAKSQAMHLIAIWQHANPIEA